MASLDLHGLRSSDNDEIELPGAWSAWRQDRLAAALSLDPVFTRRVQVLLAAGVLVFSAVGTGTSVATEPDQRQEGVAAPGEGELAAPEPAPVPVAPAPVGEGEGDPGGDTTLPVETVPEPADPGAQALPDQDETEGQLEPEPVDDPYGRFVLSDPEQSPVPQPGDPPAPPPEPSVPAPPVPPAEPIPPAPEVPSAPRVDIQPDLVPGDTETGSKRTDMRRVRRNGTTENHQSTETSADSAPAPLAPSAAPVTTGTVVVVDTSSSDQPATAPAADPPPGIPRFHIVRPGESLWAIASRLLGPRASDAAIASEVDRLWRLNAERVGTGDPNLLVVGVKLRLR